MASTHDIRWNDVRQALRELREAAGLTQRGLAEALGRPCSFVAKVELGERRIDVLELFEVCQACSVDPAQVAWDLMRRFVDAAAE